MYFFRTGKTHTIVNCVAVGLYLKLQVLLTSTNPRALRAFWEKLPPELQKLCVDFSSCVEGGMSGFHQTLETLCADLRDINERKDEIRKKIEVI